MMPKRKRPKSLEEQESSPFKVPKITPRSSTTPPTPKFTSLADATHLGNGILCEETLDLFQPRTEIACWQGNRDENQDSYYVDDSYNALDLKSLVEQTETSKLKTFCCPANKNAPGTINKTIFTVSVFDGHGPLGDLGSKLACSTIPAQIHQLAPTVTLNENHIRDAILAAITDTQNKLIRQAETQEILHQEYGTTANVAVLWSGQYLTVANVGDSRAVLYRRRENNVECIPMSMDHSLDRATERNRILASNGRILTSTTTSTPAHQYRRVIPSTKDISQDSITKRKLALGMSRSLGHLTLSRYGVISEPEFITTTLEDHDILVMASDGLWDEMSNEDVRKVILDSSVSTPKDICDSLLSTVKEKNKTKNSDNTTILVTEFVKVESVFINVNDLLPNDLTPTTSWRTDSVNSGSNHTSSSSPVKGNSMNRSDTPVIEYSEET